MAFLAGCKKRLKIAASFIVAVPFVLAPALAASGQTNQLHLYEETIKAGLVYNFLKYTAWPEHSGDKRALRVCLYGGAPLNGNLDLLQGKMAQQSTINILKINNVAEMASCNLVFINRNKQASLPEILRFLGGKPVLTISDMDQFADRGGMVEMTMEDQHVALYINKGALDHAGLNIQDRLLKLAKQVSR